jgi:probable DNA repair protein
MGTPIVMDVDAWLRGGGLVVAASDRAARAVAADYHRARRADGLTAWPAPKVQTLEEFARYVWEERTRQQRLLLNPMQEQALWAEIVAADAERAMLLEGPLHRVAGMATEAHKLLCGYAPQFLRPAARTAWQQDAGAFGGWLTAFDEACRAGGLMSASRLPLDLIEALEADSGTRAPLMLAGFDRLPPMQRRLFDAWGEWREAPRGEAAPRILFHRAGDERAELAACALWCKRQLAADPQARLLVLTQDAANRRGEMERAFLRHGAGENEAQGGSRLFEFSLGVPLRNVALGRGALLILRWLQAPIEEHELDWLFSTGHIAAGEPESRSLTAFMRALRRRGWERSRWRFEDFSKQRPGELLPTAWIARFTQAKRRLEELVRRPSASPQRTSTATPIAWAELVPQLLQLAGWPGERTLTSAEFQAMRRFERALDECASLGFDGRRIEWKDFLVSLERTVDETLFAPESEGAPILIAGPAESAGLAADAIWFLGASEDDWPAAGAAHPLLPIDVQRSAAMPHASTQLDWNLAAAITDRLLASAPEVHFSYARQCEGVEARPSRLIVKAAGEPQDLPMELAAPALPEATTAWFEDCSRIPFSGGDVRGGASALTAQSQCAFKAFATTRLGAQAWEPAEAGLTAVQRGKMLHAALHSVWRGPPDGIRSHRELTNLSDLGAFVREHVRAALEQEMPAAARETMPPKYLDLEETRLTDLVTEWLKFETARAPFVVERTEVERDTAVEGLAVRLRLDRVDRLSDETFLVIDYKTGDVSEKSWEMPRPDDVQLPLYAGFALDKETEPLGGLVFAKIRAGERSFAGRLFEARTRLLPGLSSQSALAKNKLEVEDLIEWRDYIGKMARDFLEGRADVNPRDYPRTCERCGLQTICRIREAPVEADGEESEAENA